MEEAAAKSRSLPPAKHKQDGGGGGSDRRPREGVSETEREEQEFQDRLKKCPPGERQKMIERRERFLKKGVEVKQAVISLKKSDRRPEVSRLVSEEGGDAISLSMDDTLDMFDEEEEGVEGKERDGRKPGGKRGRSLRILFTGIHVPVRTCTCVLKYLVLYR